MNFSRSALVLLAAAASASAGSVELTPDNWDAETAGKTVFLKMFAPWCGHCKKMAPDWNKLMDEINPSDTQLVADVDCTAAGKPLCDANGVKGFPTLKYGDPSDLQDYQGGRDLASLQKFVKEELKPQCSPANIDLCDDDKKAEIEKFSAMSDADLDKMIEEKEAENTKAEEDFKAFVEGLQKQYQDAMDAKDKTVEEIKASGLGLMKAVKATKAKADDKKDEL